MRSLYSETLTLVMVMDPLGNIPILLGILNQVQPARRVRLIIRETVAAFFILCLFLFFGDNILDGLGISQAALRISGGIVLFLIAIKMMFPPEQHVEVRDYVINEPFIVPLAIPMIAGPSSIATVVLLATQKPDGLFSLFGAVTFASIITLLLMLFALPLRKILGQKGLVAIERLMGMLLTMIAVQMFLDGVKEFLLN